jgi:DDE superfamily endonuclease
VDRSTEGEGREARFASYVEHMASALGHADRRTPFRSYCAGLILPGERKSIEPIAARVEPRRVQGAHPWSVRRVGLAPTGKRRLLTAHTFSGHRGSLPWTPQLAGLRAYKGRLGKDRSPRHSGHFIAHYPAPPTAGIMRASDGRRPRIAKVPSIRPYGLPILQTAPARTWSVAGLVTTWLSHDWWPVGGNSGVE